MKRVAFKALRKARGAFLVLHQHELLVLDALPLWFARLFMHLVRLSDYRSGMGSVTYAGLVAALTPIQPRSGPRHYVPDVQAVKKAVRVLEDRRILSRDKAHSQAEQSLLFMVCGRYAEARPSSELEPQTRTPPKRRKASIGAGSSGAGVGTRTPNSNPSSTSNFITSESAELSTARRVSDLLRETRDRIANPSPLSPHPRDNSPPVGGKNVARCARLPPQGLRPSRSA